MELVPLRSRRRVAEDVELDRDTAELHTALTELMRVYQFRDRDRICCHDLSVSQYYALAAVVEGAPLTLNELAAELYLEKSSASRVVDGLQAKGYVARRAHPEDGRALLLEATPRGRAMHGRIEAEVLAEERVLLADFDPEVRQAMTRLIARLARAASGQVDTAGGRCCRVTA
jgi:MarR family transcriptional regulator, 2-MHQ and catechol-resistance regulon repressor